MARLNIETSQLFKGKNAIRFQKLLIKCGDRHRAKGMLWELWELAQAHWFPDRQPIPQEDWDSAGLDDSLVECGFVEKVEGGYYARGSEDQFAWLFSKQENGRKGGLAKASKTKPKKVLASASGSQATASGRQASAKRNVASLLLTPSSLLVNTSFPTERGDSVPERPIGAKSPIGFFIGKYVKAYQARYGARPELADKKIQGQIKLFVESRSIEEAVQLVETYLQMDDPWFQKKAHDFITFKENLQKVGLAMQTGKDDSSNRVRSIEEILADQKNGVLNANGRI